METNQQKHKLINPPSRYEDFKFELPPNTYPKQVLQTSFKYPPDCGEKSYVASGRLKGRHALVTGGDSGIGRAVVSKQLQDTPVFHSKPRNFYLLYRVCSPLASDTFLQLPLHGLRGRLRADMIPSTPTSLVHTLFPCTLIANYQHYSRVCP